MKVDDDNILLLLYISHFTVFMYSPWQLMKMKKLQAIQRSIQRASNEALALTKQIIKHKPTSRIDFRQMLLQAQTTTDRDQHNHNRIALNLLKLDKEFNLIQYHGPQKYISNHLSGLQLPSYLSFFQNWDPANPIKSSTQKVESIKNNDNPNPKAQARVAFMITAQQRQILITEYNFTQGQIKSMTPNEAQMIIRHSIYALGENDSSWRENIKKLIEKEVEEQKKVEQQMQLIEQEGMVTNKQGDGMIKNILSIGFEERLESQSPSIKESNRGDEIQIDELQNNGDDHKKELLLLGNDDSVAPSENRSDSITAETSDGQHTNSKNCWYEVISTTTSSNEVVALYRSYEEAQEFIMIKEDLATKRRGDPSSSQPEKFLIRKRVVL